MSRIAVAAALVLSLLPLSVFGQSRVARYPYHSGGYEFRSYEYQSYGYPASNYVGRPSYGYYPNGTARYHYTAPRITTGQGYVNPVYSGSYYRGNYGRNTYSGWNGYRSGYSRSGPGAYVPRYYGR